MLYIFIFYFLSSALLDSWSVPPTGWYWFLTAFCYFLLWTHTVDAIKGGVWSFCNPIEGYRVRREDGERWLFSFFSSPSPGLLFLFVLPFSFPVRRPHSGPLRSWTPLSSLLRNYFFHPLSFCHTSPFSIDLSSALKKEKEKKSFRVSGLRRRKKKQ